MDAVADEAQVSRATAYRYFPSLEALLCEAPLEAEIPAPETVFEGLESDDPIVRAVHAEQMMHEATYRNEAQLRAMLIHSLSRPGRRTDDDGGDVPVRQNRRSAYIAMALEPVRDKLDPAMFDKLSAALALIFGTEAMIVCNDVLQIDEQSAAEVKRWAVEALIRGALD